MKLQLKKRLDREEQAELFAIMNATTNDEVRRQARNKLIEHNLRLVWSISKSFVDDFEQEELLSIGTIGLIYAIDNFDVKKKVKFKRYAYLCIIEEIKKQIKIKDRIENKIEEQGEYE